MAHMNYTKPLVYKLSAENKIKLRNLLAPLKGVTKMQNPPSEEDSLRALLTIVMLERDELKKEITMLKSIHANGIPINLEPDPYKIPTESKFITKVLEGLRARIQDLELKCHSHDNNESKIIQKPKHGNLPYAHVNIITNLGTQEQLKKGSVFIAIAEEELENFKLLVQKACNTWHEAPPSIKEFADKITNNGIVWQNYWTQR